MSKPRGRPFQPGNTIGRGRPKGSRNKAKAPGQDLLDQYSEPVTRKCISMALQGDARALRICMERMSPARQDAFVQLSLPRIRTAQDVEKAAEKVTQAIRRGKITPLEGGKLMSILESRARIMENVEFESRLEKLEENLAASNKLPHAA
jgi:predicted DNA-binding protein (UPF0251 family)